MPENKSPYNNRDFPSPPQYARTRQPTNLAGAFETQAETTTSAHPASAINKAPSYRTHNQRYLWLQLDTSTSGETKTVTVYGVNYSFGRWAPLKDASGNAVTITCANALDQKVFEIAGVDRVYFLISSGALNASDFFFAGCNTLP
jgi:hypothetical protein